MLSGETANPKHTVIVEDPDDKVRGLVQTLVSKDNGSLRFRGTVDDRAQSSMSTPMGTVVRLLAGRSLRIVPMLLGNSM